ncbi:branched-chain amino acid ABC transporter substrate-binding protein [Azospirillum thiophilum]|uniref:Branched-chain amino acid ABC transporter substrate-binding protein n=2 Tax=Azospirillum thiophilum TaxID=528244 RepID=A0AAC8W488_9PROT|nr:branched-chain amino acid ABC transporter substrate-binding protein [Azospirillum thiophilum]KJR61820.1 branched-chain amino acid ABC transporter substrate-binding protein [Azospirillum thiophilum]
MVRFWRLSDRRSNLSHAGRWLAAAVLSAAMLAPATASTAVAQDGGAQAVVIGYLARHEDPRTPASFLEPVATDEGLQGARLALADNTTTGMFLNQSYRLVEQVLPADGDIGAGLKALADEGVRFVVADLPADALLSAADRPEARSMLLFNARAPDDALRNEQCRPNILHTAASRRMLADALAQYLAWKKWTGWSLLIGRNPGDALYAEAIRRAAKRFGGRIVAETTWTFDTGNRRTDTGITTIQSDIPLATQGPDYEVLIVADEIGDFGDYLDGRTWRPRPVAGTQGLTATGWSRVNEQWGGTQLQSRFEKLAGRWMTARDYAAWLAVRSVGEAAARTGGTGFDDLAAYLRSPDFELAGFKGEALSFRAWDGQMRQPILIAGPRMLVSVSPQEGFLHPVTPLDTLGDDAPETKCRPNR